MKNLEIIFEKAGFEIIRTRYASSTSSKYITISNNFNDYIIRYADHSDCYGTTDFNVNTEDGDNVDGMSFDELLNALNITLTNDINDFVNEVSVIEFDNNFEIKRNTEIAKLNKYYSEMISLENHHKGNTEVADLRSEFERYFTENNIKFTQNKFELKGKMVNYSISKKGMKYRIKRNDNRLITSPNKF